MGVLVVAFLLVVSLRAAHGDILPGVTVAGTDLGGAEEDARAQLEVLDETRRTDPVTVVVGDESFTLDPGSVGYRIDIDATLDAARLPGRDGGFLATSWDHVAALWRDVDLEPVEVLDEQALAAWVASVGAEVNDEPFPGALHIDPATLAVSTEAPGPGQQVDEDEIAASVREALSTAGPETLGFEPVPVPARIEPAAVEAVAAQARGALNEPLRLTANDATLTLEPSQLASMMLLREVSEGDTWTVELAVEAAAVEAAVGGRASEFEREPVSASFDLPREPPATLDDQDDTSWTPVPVDARIVPSQPGETFDAGLAATQISELLQQGTTTAPLRLRPVEPEFTTADGEAFGITHLIGTFTTYHACCQSRVTNIQLLADMVDGTTVAPGEQFSVNQISGERTCGKGFRAAGMILNGELVDVCGGGTSQFGTTTFNAAFFAGLPIDQYKAHSWYISRYPMGREATLNYPSPDIDVRFTNTTDAGILVRTSYTGTSITVSLYGDNGEVTVRAIHGSPTNYRGFGTRTRENKALPPGASRVVQSGAQGFDVTVVRVLEQPDGTEEREEFFTRYTPIVKIVEQNSDPAPPPPDEDPPDDGEPEPPPEEGGDEPPPDGGGDEPPPSEQPDPGQ